MFLKKLRPSRNLFSMFCTTAAPKATTSQEGEAAGAKSEGDSPKSKPNALSWIKKNLTFTKNKATSAAPETSQESESQGNNVAGPEPKVRACMLHCTAAPVYLNAAGMLMSQGLVCLLPTALVST
jgi:hypothetical protein